MARILLVDDDKDIRTLGISLLNQAGHESFAAESAVAAIEFLQTHSVDLLITDANMPQHSGFDLIRTIRREPRFHQLTLAMLTGRRERKDIERAVSLGVHDYIIKPLDPMLFLQKIQDLLERRPPAERASVDFAAVKIASRAQISSEIELVSLSELGLNFRSPHRYREGERLEAGGEIFEEIIGVEMPILRVQSSVEREGDIWETRVVFIGADEKVLTKIRAWVYSHSTKGLKSA